MRIGRKIPISCILMLSCAAGGAQSLQKPEPPLRTIVTARAVHSLSHQEAARHVPVHLRATVTYYDPFIDPRHGALFVVDRSGGVFVVVPSRPVLPLHAGMLVEVAGVSGPGDYAPVVEQSRVRVVGESSLPKKSFKVTVEQLLTGSVDCQWVEVQGLVHAVRFSPTNAVLDIATAGGPVTAIVLREAGARYDLLVDALIVIHGNAAPVFNRKRQMVGVHLYVPSLDQVKVVQPAPSDPYAVPALSIRELLQFTPVLELPHQTRVQGRVTLEWPGRLLCVEQSHDGICVQTAQETQVPVGTPVDVIGFPAIEAYKATLENATFRPQDTGTLPSPATPLTVDQAFSGEHDGELVSIEGELIGRDLAGNDLALMLRAGSFIFPAIIARDQAHPQLFRWEDGSRLRVTGVCIVQVDAQNTTFGEGAVRPGAIRILLRSAGDVEVLRSPSWWTPGHALAVVAVGAVVAFAAFAWIVVLRRRVEQQTQALRSSEERLRHLSQHDALTNLPNRLLLNDRLDVALHRAIRNGEGLGLLMVDLDFFKEVNDSFGHHVGDQLLSELAERLCRSVRKTDTVARIGGDEFIVLMPDLHEPEEASMIAAKIVATGSAPFQLGAAEVRVSVSVGVCTFPEGGTDAKTLLQSVDTAMYRAKALGKNRFQIYSPEYASNQSRSSETGLTMSPSGL